MAEAQLRVVSFTPTETGVDVLFSGDLNAVVALTERFFQTNGFRLEEGTSSAGVYGKGNKVARALIGGLVKREKFDVYVGTDGESVGVRIASPMSGWSGSALGRSREKKARRVIAEQLHAFISAQAGEAPGTP